MENYRVMKMLKIAFLIIFVVTGVLLAVSVKNIAMEVYNTTYNSSDKNELENLQYSFDGENFYDYNNFETEDVYNKKQSMVLKGTLNIDSLKNPVLYIETKNNYYEVYINGEQFLFKEKYNLLNSFRAIDFKSLQKSYNGKEVEIYLYSKDPNKIADGLQVFAVNKFQIVSEIIFDGLGSVVFSVLTICAGLLLVSSYVSKRYRYYGLSIIGYLSCLMGAVWLFSFNTLILVFSDKLYLISFIISIAMYQVPIAILLFTHKYEKNKVIKVRIKAAINIYLIFLIGILFLEILNIINIQDFSVYIAIAIMVINIYSLSVFVRQIKFKELFAKNDNRPIDYNNKRQKENYANSVFGRFIPLVFSIFLIINLIGSLMFVLLQDQTYYIISIGISTVIILLFCGVLFSHDLRKINQTATTDQERRALNRSRINLLVEEQAKLFSEVSIENIADKFSNNIKGILFPYGNLETSNVKITSDEVRDQYTADYNTFVKEASSIVYIMTPDESSSSGIQHRIVAGTGQYESYVSKDPQKEMDKDEFSEILFVMKGIKPPSPNDMAVIIGTEIEPKGIILFKNIGSVEGLLKGLLESYVRTCAILIENLKLIAEARSIQYDTVYNLNEISELRSKETGFHIKRVSLYSALLGEKLGLNKEEIEILQLASSMHDIGKINISDKILNKPGKLTESEFDIMKTHAIIGYDILKNTNNNVMKVSAMVARYHHEKYNGKGYYGLKGEEIPKVARIVAVADVFDALSVERVYKPAWPLEKVMDLFKKERNEHFDGELVDILFEYLDEFLEIRDRYKEED